MNNDDKTTMKLDNKFDDRVSGEPCAGHIAFEAYSASVSNVAHTGREIPPWHELPEHIRGAWQVGAEAAIADAIGRGLLVRVKPPVVATANRG
jgi:hypothetical protein